MNAPLSPDRAAQIRHHVDRIVSHPPEERAAVLDTAFREDPRLRRDLLSWLTSDDASSDTDPSTKHVITSLLATTSPRRPSTESDKYIGRTVSHYSIIERLGGGGMGVVYKARDTRLDRTVALKFLTPELLHDPGAKARFVREAKAASALDHPNICTIYEIGETDGGQLFIAMAHYAGETIKAKIEHGPIPPKNAASYAAAIAEGLRRAHAAGIVHRDVKPANIIVPEQGPLKLVDFGLATASGLTQLTRSGTTIGTVAYMSPEQAQGDAVDERTDLWSLGIVLYEMVTGQRPFRGDYEQAVLYSIVNQEPDPIRQLDPDLPDELEQIIRRAMQKDPEARYTSAAEMIHDLNRYRDRRTGDAGALDPRAVLRPARRPRVAFPTIGVLLLVVLSAVWFFDRQSKIGWARTEALPEIERLVEGSWRDYTEAYALAEEAEQYIPNDPTLTDLLARSSFYIDVETEPSGADVYMKEYDEPEGPWRHLGVTPLDSIRVPFGIFRWKLEKEGYEKVEAAASTWEISREDVLFIPNHFSRTLDEEGSLPRGMVRVKGAETPHGAVADFFIDRFEVTNAEYKAFVDSGGYRNRDFWQHEFIKDGRTLSWEQAMAEFVDQTGRPGPSTWQAGDYPSGQDHYPVSGVSWYEAAAYARYAGKSLPTGVHWGLARGEATTLIRVPQLGGAAVFAPFSNFSGAGPIATGELSGITSFGAYDMAGNVREWCANETAKGRLIRGGSWNDNPYMFSNLSQAPPFDRSDKNGFRCARYPDREHIPASVFEDVRMRSTRDFYAETPVDDAIFQVYEEQFAYDQTGLNARVESVDDSAEDWIHERISVDAAYGGERLFLHLFLPRDAEPPYQTVLYFPGSSSRFQASSEDLTSYYEFPVFLSFLLKNGRAVLYPVYNGTFERQVPDMARVSRGGRDTHRWAEYVIQWVKDFKRSIDYLQTRPDVDTTKLAYYGMSWGGAMGPIITAVEDRLQASILAPGAFLPEQVRPEVDQLNYVTRVTVPTLMLNGRYDTIAPVETNIRPLFDLLGTPPEDKALKLYETDHIPPRNEYIKATLSWLDRYLGRVD